ncbi:MAG: tape measure protein [Methylobacter sp.]|uniref:Tape measure protein n=1 Tax=Candidatus Methylobacter titanis TaxID=3053457 RepID=A0AA43Q5Y9_9GAMM|nr:tape measure protein [Candidatus Methylobacter titanis]
MSDLSLSLRIRANADGTVSVINGVGNSINRVTESTDRATQSMRHMAHMAAGAFGIDWAAGKAKELIQLADQMTLLDGRIKIATKTTQDYINSSKELVAISMRTGTAFEANATIFARINKAMEDMGGSARHTTALTETLAQTMRISGAGAQEAASTIRQLSQAMASGVLRGDEFNSVMENAPRLAQALASGLNVSIGSLRAMAEAGELTSKRVIEAIQSQSNVIDEEFGKIPLTVGAAMTNISTAFGQYVLEANKGSGATAGLAGQLNLLASNLAPVIDGVLTLGKIAAAVFAGQIAIALSTYVKAKYAAITAEMAHAAAITIDLERTVVLTAAQAANTSATVASLQAQFAVTTAMGARIAITNSLNIALVAQTSATAAATAATNALSASAASAALSLKSLLSVTSLVNIALAGLVGWEIGSWLNKFETVRRVANDSLFAILTMINEVSYKFNQVSALFSGKDLTGLTAAYEAEKASLQDLISENNTYVKGVTDAAAAATQQTSALAPLAAGHEAVGKAVKANAAGLSETEKAAKSHADAISNEIAALTDQHNKLSLTERAYQLLKFSALGMSDAVNASSIAIWDSNKALEAQKAGVDAGVSAMDAENMKYKELTLSARDYYAAKLQAQGVNPEGIQKNLKQFDANADVTANNADITAAITAMDSYTSSIASAKSETQNLGDVTGAVLDGALGGIRLLASAFDKLIESTEKNAEAMTKLGVNRAGNDAAQLKANQAITRSVVSGSMLESAAIVKRAEIKQRWSINEIAFAKEQAELEDQRTREALANGSRIAGAASKMFEEKSAAARAFHGIEMGLAALSMAMAIKKMVVDLAAGAAAMFGQSGWGGFAGVAAMGVVMAGLGVAMTGSSAKSPGPQGLAADTGTVLGDSTAKSESIDRTYQLLKDIHADEYAELRGINAGIASLSSGITDVVTRLFQAGGMTTVNAAGSKITGIHGMLNSIDPLGSMGLDPIGQFILGGLFGGKKTNKVVAQGISTGETSIADIMTGGNLSAQQFAQIETKTSGGWFGKDKYKTSNQYSELDAGTQKALNSVFKSMGSTMLGLADNLGLGLSDRVKNYIIPALNVDLKGLDGEAAAKKLNGVISASLDTMSTSVFGDILSQYQQLGEGMLETAVRIVNQMAVVKDALSTSGLSIGTDAIALSDSLVKAAGGLQEFQKQFDTYYDKFYTGAEKQQRLQSKMSDQLSDVNLSLASSRDSYRQQLEAVNLNTEAGREQYSTLLRLSGAADEYYTTLENLAVEQQNLVAQQRSLDIALMEAQGKAAEALAASRADELAAMDKTLRATQNMIYAINDLAAAQEKALTSANKTVDEAMSRLTRSVSAEKAVLAEKYKADSDALSEQLKGTLKVNAEQKKSSGDLLTSIRSIAGKLRSALDSTVIETAELTYQRRLTAQTVLQSALAFAKSGGALSGFAGIESSLDDIAKPSEQLFSSFEEYARDQGRTANVITNLAGFADAQVSVAEQTLIAIDFAANAAQKYYDEQYRLLTDAYTAETTRLDQIIKDAQTQIDVLRGIDNSVISVADALRALSAALLSLRAIAPPPPSKAAQTALKKVEGSIANGDYQSSGGAAYSAATQLITGNTGNTYTMPVAQTWVNDQLAVGNPTLIYNKAISEGISAQSLDTLMGWSAGTSNGWASENRLPTFATGGDHLGGLRIVGENGPELESTGPSRIFNAQQTRGILSGGQNTDEWVAEIRALRKTVERLEQQLEQVKTNTGGTERNTRDTATVLGKVTLGGTTVRTTSA